MESPVWVIIVAWNAVCHVAADDWSWVAKRRQRKKKKVLCGFARASGDHALTAPIHDLLVLPELQGLGLGRKLLAKAANQVTKRDLTTGFVVIKAEYFQLMFTRCRWHSKSCIDRLSAQAMSTGFWLQTLSFVVFTFLSFVGFA